MNDPTEDKPPLPLMMTEDEQKRLISYLFKTYGDPAAVQTRVLIEILDALRMIDDKLGRLVEVNTKDQGPGTKDHY